jgi:hypothetical protein
MGIYRGPNNVTKDLEFGFDIGHGVADNTYTTRFYQGEPTTNLLSNVDDWSNWTGNLFSNWINATVTPNAGIAPDGTLTASKLTGGYSRFQRISCSTNTTYTFSFWIKNIDLPIAAHIHIAFGLNNSLVNYNNLTNIALNTMGEWTRVSKTHTSPSSGINQMEVGVAWSANHPNQNSVLVWHAMCEQKDHLTPFTVTSRSDIASLIDLKRSIDIDVGGISFSNTAEAEFDGSDDKITLSHANSPVTNVSYEMVVKFDTLPATNSYKSIWQKQTNWNNAGGVMMQFIYNAFRWSYGNSWGGAVSYPQSNFTTGKYYHIVGTVDNINGANAKLYVNGVQVGSTGTGSKLNTTAVLNIGEGNGGNLDGSLGVFKMYSNTLTAEDVKQNFNTYKNRFNI